MKLAIRILIVILVGMSLGLAKPVTAQQPKTIADDVDIDPQIGNTIPRDLVMQNSSGDSVRLGDFLDDKPILLTPVYYRCPMLCGMELNGLVTCLRAMKLDVGKDFEIVTYSIDHREDSRLAAEKKQSYLKKYGRPNSGAGWHWLTGSEEAIERLNECIGFQSRYDPETGQYAHAAGIVVVTPEGRISRYLYGVEFAPRDLRLSLVEASQNELSDLTDRVLLLCYAYDPTRGTYGLAIYRTIRIAGLLTVIVIAGIIARFLLRDRRNKMSATKSFTQTAEEAT